MRSSLHEAELGMEMMVDVMLEDSHYLDKCAERQRRSKVSLGPKRAPFDLRMVKVERGRGVHSGSYTLETLALGPLTRAREEERGGGMHASHTLAQRAQ